MNLKDIMNNTTIKNFNMTYDEFSKLDFDTQEKLIEEYRKHHVKKQNKKVTTMMGNGDNAMFVKVNKGDKVLIGSGKDSIFIKAGTTPEKERQAINDKIDDMGHSKPVVMVKRLIRKFKHK